MESKQILLNQLHERIKIAAESVHRNPNEIKLIAVSKTKPSSDIEEFKKLGLLDFGENKVQEMTSKWDELNDEQIIWHMIGGIQSNKLKYLAPRVNWIHSISKISYLKELEKRLKPLERKVNVLIQVNISDEDQKSGCEPSDLDEILHFASSCKYIVVKGLMGMASNETDLEMVRPQFRLLKELRDSHANDYNSKAIDLKELSMGMTNDLEVAIQEGSTMVRVGSALFGKRNYL